MFIFSSYFDNIEETEQQNFEMESINMTMKVVDPNTGEIKNVTFGFVNAHQMLSVMAKEERVIKRLRKETRSSKE